MSHQYSYPEITPGLHCTLVSAIAISIAGSGSSQHEYAESYGYDVESLASEGSTQCECAAKIVLDRCKSAQDFHNLCIDYCVYESYDDIYLVKWDRYSNNHENARIHIESWAAARGSWEYDWLELCKSIFRFTF